MKILFVGPTLPDAADIADPKTILRPPARQGDIAAAIEEGADVIGLIDGLFENVAPVWHKEILVALSKGIQVFGAASMGALRAAECAAFGMVGIGGIYQAYASGALVDDAAVAQIHGPAELGYLPLSEPLVKVGATLHARADAALITDAELAAMIESARNMFFKELSYRSVAAAALAIAEPARRQTIAGLLRANAVNRKRADALALLQVLADCPDER